jgi:hypothetical protein
MSGPTIDDAIDALRKLRPDRQAELAGYIFHLASDNGEPEDIDPAHLAAVLEGLEQFASPERVAAAFRRFEK